MGEQQVEGFSDEGVLPAGPRIVMTKSSHMSDVLVRFDAPDQEQVYLTLARWEQLGSPEKIEVRLEAF